LSALGGTVWTGSGDPSAGTGEDTDIYLNTTSKEWFKKTSGAWASIGVQGNRLHVDDDTDPDSGDGVDDDTWFNIDSKEFFLKESGSWVSKTTLGAASHESTYDHDELVDHLGNTGNPHGATAAQLFDGVDTGSLTPTGGTYNGSNQTWIFKNDPVDILEPSELTDTSSPHALDTDEMMGFILNNEGATGPIEFDLATPAEGHEFWVAVVEAYTISLDPYAGTKFTLNGVAGSNDEFISNSTGSAGDVLYCKYLGVADTLDCSSTNSGWKLNSTGSTHNMFYIDIGANSESDDTAQGVVLTDRNAGESIFQWETVFFNSADSEYHQADADASGEWPARGLAMTSGSDGNELSILVLGRVRNDSWNWSTVGGPLYLSDTAGGITETAPITSGDCHQIIGWVLSDDEAYFMFTPHYLVVK